MIRQAKIPDIGEMHRIRLAVRENRLNYPDLVGEKDYEEYLTGRGNGWVAELDKEITGFAIVDLRENNVWALFIDPEHERKGFGKELHIAMMDWYFMNTDRDIWLSTAPGTRAEIFYRNAGWKETGKTKSGEIRFEMTKQKWSESDHS